MIDLFLQLFGGGGSSSGASGKTSTKPKKPKKAKKPKAAGQSFDEAVHDVEQMRERKKQIDEKLGAMKKEMYAHMGRSKADKEAYARIEAEYNQLIPQTYQLTQLIAGAERYLTENYPTEWAKYQKEQKGHPEEAKKRKGIDSSIPLYKQVNKLPSRGKVLQQAYIDFVKDTVNIDLQPARSTQFDNARMFNVDVRALGNGNTAVGEQRLAELKNLNSRQYSPFSVRIESNGAHVYAIIVQKKSS